MAVCNVLEYCSLDGLIDILKKFGEPTNFSSETERSSANSPIFIGSVECIFKTIKENHDKLVLVVLLKNLLDDKEESETFRTIFVGSIVKYLSNYNLAIGDVIAILKPKFFIAWHTPSLNVGPNDPVVWLLKNHEPGMSHTQGKHRTIIDLTDDESQEFNSTCTSSVQLRTNEEYRYRPVNLQPSTSKQSICSSNVKKHRFAIESNVYSKTISNRPSQKPSTVGSVKEDICNNHEKLIATSRNVNDHKRKSTTSCKSKFECSSYRSCRHCCNQSFHQNSFCNSHCRHNFSNPCHHTVCESPCQRWDSRNNCKARKAYSCTRSHLCNADTNCCRPCYCCIKSCCSSVCRSPYKSRCLSIDSRPHSYVHSDKRHCCSCDCNYCIKPYSCYRPNEDALKSLSEMTTKRNSDSGMDLTEDTRKIRTQDWVLNLPSLPRASSFDPPNSASAINIKAGETGKYNEPFNINSYEHTKQNKFKDKLNEPLKSPKQINKPHESSNQHTLNLNNEYKGATKTNPLSSQQHSEESNSCSQTFLDKFQKQPHKKRLFNILENFSLIADKSLPDSTVIEESTPFSSEQTNTIWSMEPDVSESVPVMIDSQEIISCKSSSGLPLKGIQYSHTISGVTDTDDNPSKSSNESANLNVYQPVPVSDLIDTRKIQSDQGTYLAASELAVLQSSKSIGAQDIILASESTVELSQKESIPKVDPGTICNQNKHSDQGTNLTTLSVPVVLQSSKSIDALDILASKNSDGVHKEESVIPNSDSGTTDTQKTLSGQSSETSPNVISAPHSISKPIDIQEIQMPKSHGILCQKNNDIDKNNVILSSNKTINSLEIDISNNTISDKKDMQTDLLNAKPQNNKMDCKDNDIYLEKTLSVDEEKEASEIENPPNEHISEIRIDSIFGANDITSEGFIQLSPVKEPTEPNLPPLVDNDHITSMSISDTNSPTKLSNQKSLSLSQHTKVNVNSNDVIKNNNNVNTNPVNNYVPEEVTKSLTPCREDEMELQYEAKLNKRRRRKRRKNSSHNNNPITSPQGSVKSVETIDLENDNTASIKSQSSGMTYFDAASTSSSPKKSKLLGRTKWLMKPLNELFPDRKEALLKVVPVTKLTSPLEFKIFKSMEVIGVILDMIPNLLEHPYSIIKGVCHGKCHKTFSFDALDKLGRVPITLSTCLSCTNRHHLLCPGCFQNGENMPICLFYSFEIHLLHAENVFRIEVENQDAIEFLGCSPPVYLFKGSYLHTEELLKQVMLLPSHLHWKRLRAQLRAKIKIKPKTGGNVLVLTKTSLKKDIIHIT